MKAEHIKYSILNIQSKIRLGFTLVELMVTMLIALLVFAGIGVAMVDSISGFGKMYERTTENYQRQDITPGVIPDAYVARATFDSICRKASMYYKGIDNTNTWVTVYYYSSMSSTLTVPDECAKFAFANNKLIVSYGTANAPYDGTTDTLGTQIALAKNVTACKFDIQGSSVIMAITIDNSNDNAARQKMKLTVTCTAVRHNE